MANVFTSAYAATQFADRTYEVLRDPGVRAVLRQVTTTTPKELSPVMKGIMSEGDVTTRAVKSTGARHHGALNREPRTVRVGKRPAASASRTTIAKAERLFADLTALTRDESEMFHSVGFWYAPDDIAGHRKGDGARIVDLSEVGGPIGVLARVNKQSLVVDTEQGRERIAFADMNFGRSGRIAAHYADTKLTGVRLLRKWKKHNAAQTRIRDAQSVLSNWLGSLSQRTHCALWDEVPEARPLLAQIYNQNLHVSVFLGVGLSLADALQGRDTLAARSRRT